MTTMTVSFQFKGEQLVFGKAHIFTVTLNRAGSSRTATFNTNGHNYPSIRITAWQWDCLVARQNASKGLGF